MKLLTLNFAMIVKFIHLFVTLFHITANQNPYQHNAVSHLRVVGYISVFAKFTVSNPMATASLPMIAIDFFNQAKSVVLTEE